MKAAFRTDDDIYLKDISALPLGPGQIRLRVDACGVCGTDLQRDPALAGTEVAMTGHEIAGTVIDVAPGIDWLEPGRKVALDSSTPCGHCNACKNGEQELCTDIQSFFMMGSFGFAPEMTAPAISTLDIGDLDPAVACLQEPLGVAIDMVRLADIRPGDNVLIMGAGTIGLMALALAKRAGAARVFVSQNPRRAARCALARTWGADAIVTPDAVATYDFGCSLERVLVTAPPKALTDAFNVAAKGGIISFIGIEHGQGATCSFDANAFHFKKLQLRASFASPAMFGPQAIDLLRSGMVDGDALVTHRFPLEEVGTAVETSRDSDAIKVVVEPR